MSFAKTFCALALLATGSACRDRRAETTEPAARVAAPSGARPADTQALRAAELRRDSAAIGAAALSNRDVRARRLAARALARIADAPAASWLRLALADEDPEVVTWSAYGLGYACRGREAQTVSALAVRAASLPNDARTHSLESPIEAISDALGRCASAEAEKTLRLWLTGPTERAEAAALGLGRIASGNGKLEDSTLVLLLDSADRGPASLTNALYPLSRLSNLNPSTSDRARTVSLATLQSHAAGLEFALRTLARTGPDGATALGALLSRSDLLPGLRAQATRELAALGAAGQRPLWAAFSTAGKDAPSDAALLGADYGPFSALLDALKPPLLGSGNGSLLQALAELPIKDGDAPSLVRRKVHVRCTAAALLAGSNFESRRLLSCDPAPDSSVRERRVLEVIGREMLRGPRKRAYLQRAREGHDLVREAAIDLLPEHGELDESYRVLADALAAKSPGVVASAARVLAGYPERAGAAKPADNPHDAPSPHPSVTQALTRAYDDAVRQHSVEVQGLLLDAIGALQILTLKDAANAACAGDNPTLREHAQKALRLLGEQSRRCDDFKPGPDTPVPPEAAGRSLLSFETEAATLTLTLDPSLSPSAVARIVLLAQAGFYDGTVVHRVVPGFVAQFGDPTGDGYGGDQHPPLRCETSPVPFLTGSVGVALSGRDTGSSQLFVTLGRYPHLDGQYAWLGQAGPGWDRVAVGDRIMHTRVSSVP